MAWVKRRPRTEIDDNLRRWVLQLTRYGVAQSEICERTGLSQASISRIQRAAYDAKTLYGYRSHHPRSNLFRG